MKDKTTLLLIVLFSGLLIHAQQIPILNHYILNKFALNPAVAGSFDYSPVRLNIKTQWVGFDKAAPKTQWLSGHTRINQYGLGGSIFNDQYGSFRRIGVNLAYSYILEINSDMKLAIGLAPNVFQFSIEYHIYEKDMDGNVLQIWNIPGLANW